MSKDLSIFIDESGDVGPGSKYYLVALVLHSQDDNISQNVARLLEACNQAGIYCGTFHFTPIIRAHHPFDSVSPEERRKFFSAFAYFANKTPFRYALLSYRKSEYAGSAKLKERIERETRNLIQDNLAFFQQFDFVKIYYDNGQRAVKDAIHSAIESTISPNAIEYRDADPNEYRLFQIADYVCGIELTDLRFSKHEAGASEENFFGGYQRFKKNYLKKIRKKRLN